MNVLPAQFLKSLQSLQGFHESSFKQIHESRKQVTSIRINPAKPAALSIIENTMDVPWCSTGKYLAERPSFTLDPTFHAGAYYVQEASSMFLDHVIRQLYPDRSPSTVLDLCAAPGGKSTLLAGALQDSFIVSNEVIKSRVTILAENISKWGSNNVMVTNNDPKDFIRLAGYFDLMVVDAPCSGSGLFRKDPTAIDEWSEANVQMCSVRQQRILKDVLVALRGNGYLIYSTCSYSKDEDEDICDWIVEQFKLQPVPLNIDPSWGIIETFSDRYQSPAYRFYPDKLKGEGFFIACFKQVNEVEEHFSYSTASPPLARQEQEIVNQYVSQPTNYRYYKQKETIIAFQKKWEEEFITIQKNLSARKSGIAIGVIKGKDLIPHHELALSGIVSADINRVELDKFAALKYLKRQDFNLPDAKKGWALAVHNGINLGWMKVLPNRVNNYYPTEWRILKD